MNLIKTYQILTVLILFASCSERITVSDADALGLRFKVKSMIESFYLAYTSFDNLVLYKKIYRRRYDFYHDCRYKSIEKQYWCNAMSRDSVGHDIEHDSTANVFPDLFKEPDCHINYKYISDSFVRLEFFDPQDNPLKYIDRQYEHKRLMSEMKYAGSGDMISKSVFRYDAHNKLLSKTVFYQNGYREIHCSYLTGEKFVSTDELNYQYRFDIQGRTVNRKTYEGTGFVSETLFYYNGYGDLTASYETDKNGIIKEIRYRYTYDANNNWTLCVEYNHTGNIFVRKREITYYN